MKKKITFSKIEWTFTFLIFALELSHIVRALLKIPLYGDIELFFGYVDLSSRHTDAQIGFTYVLVLLGLI